MTSGDSTLGYLRLRVALTAGNDSSLLPALVEVRLLVTFTGGRAGLLAGILASDSGLTYCSGAN